MCYPKLLQHLIERKRSVTVYLSREAFEQGVTRHLARGSTAARDNAVLHVRLSSYAAVRTHVGAVAARELLRSTASILLRTSNAIAAVYLGEGTFAVLMSEIQPEEAELHADFLIYSISDMRLQRGDLTLCSDAFAGLAIANGRQDGKALLAAAEAAGQTAQKKSGGRSRVELVDEISASEAQERFIPSYQIADVCLDDVNITAVYLN